MRGHKCLLSEPVWKVEKVESNVDNSFGLENVMDSSDESKQQKEERHGGRGQKTASWKRSLYLPFSLFLLHPPPSSLPLELLYGYIQQYMTTQRTPATTLATEG